MPIRVYQRPSGVYHLRGTHLGVRIDRSSGLRDRRQAQILAAQTEAQIFERHVRGPKSVSTFAEAALGYQRGGGDGSRLAPLIERFGLMRLADLSQADLDRAAHELHGLNKTSTQIRSVYTPFSAVWNWAVDSNLAERRTWRKPTPPAGRIDWRTPQEMERLIAACSPQIARAVVFYLGTGARASEAVDLEWRDVSPDALRAVLWVTKGGYSRHVDLIPRVRMSLPVRRDGAVFRNQAGASWHAYDAVALGVRRACRRANIAPLGLHVLRHTWATWAYAVTRDLAWLMAQGGWRTADLAMRYIHLGTDDLAETVLAHNWEFRGRSMASQVKKPSAA